MINKREAYIALFSILVGMANIFFIILRANSWVIGAFSFAMSIEVFYFAWRELMTLDFMKQIKTMLLLSAVEKDLTQAWKNVSGAVKNAPNPWVEEESKDR